MLEKVYLHLIILCGIWCHGIIGTLSDEDTRESSDLLVRKRRVISRLPGGLDPVKIERVNYIVVIKQFNRANCAGVILSHYTVITAALCMQFNVSHYLIISGSGYDVTGNPHHVTSKSLYSGNHPQEEFDGLALITVDPAFVYTRKTGYINLYVGPLAAGTHGTVTGWGCVYPMQPPPQAIKRKLRSVTLQIIGLGECRNIYRRQYSITEKHICTYDEHQFCAYTDAGAPLVVNNSLAGIHVWKGVFADQRNPDVFIDLQNPYYSAWIRENTILM